MENELIDKSNATLAAEAMKKASVKVQLSSFADASPSLHSTIQAMFED